MKQKHLTVSVIPHDTGITRHILISLENCRGLYIIAGVGINHYDNSQVDSFVMVSFCQPHSNKRGFEDAIPTFESLDTISPEIQEIVKAILTEEGFYSDISDYQVQVQEEFGDEE
jgi:hypothetical protein